MTESVAHINLDFGQINIPEHYFDMAGVAGVAFFAGCIFTMLFARRPQP